eukprot:3582216-Pyramimonas_sp.AAC.1
MVLRAGMFFLGTATPAQPGIGGHGQTTDLEAEMTGRTQATQTGAGEEVRPLTHSHLAPLGRMGWEVAQIRPTLARKVNSPLKRMGDEEGQSPVKMAKTESPMNVDAEV